MVRAHASQQCGPASNPGDNALCQLWLEFFAGSLACSAIPFSGYTAFSHLLKNQHFPIRPGMVNEEPLRGYATFKSLLFIIVIILRRVSQPAIALGYEGTIRFSNTTRTFVISLLQQMTLVKCTTAMYTGWRCPFKSTRSVSFSIFFWSPPTTTQNQSFFVN